MFARVSAFLAEQGLRPARDAEFTVIIEENGELTATGSRVGNILKYFAVAPGHRGEGLVGTVITELRKDAFMAGISDLFIYTKPENRFMFEQLHYYPVAETDRVLLMESRRDGIEKHLESVPRFGEENIGAVVMNCDPFTRGHKSLVKYASEHCDRLYIFVLSEDRSRFSAEERLELVRRGTEEFENVTVCTTGGYLVSSATFPDYFLKERSSTSAAQCELDCEIFGAHFARLLNIKTRFAGAEPLSEVTDCYNRTMEKYLPKYGISFVEIPRLTDSSGEVISASRVRALLGKGQAEELRKLLPDTTFEYLSNKGLI